MYRRPLHLQSKIKIPSHISQLITNQERHHKNHLIYLLPFARRHHIDLHKQILQGLKERCRKESQNYSRKRCRWHSFRVEAS